MAPKPSLHQVYSPFWSVEPGYESTVQLHNNLPEALLVRPVLLSPSGIRIELPDLTLPKLGNAYINLHDALAGAGNTVTNWGSAVFEYTSLYAGALLAETTVSEPEETLSYTIIGSESGAKSKKLYGVYWFPQGKEAKAYIALQNASDNPIHVSAQLGIEPSSPFSSVTLGPRQSQLIGAIIPNDNSGRGNSKDRSGSIVLTHDGAEGALITSGWTEMEDSGYSNMMTLYDPARHTGTHLYGAQIFLGKRDDLLASGKSLKIESYLMLLNTSDSWVSPHAELAYKSLGKVERLPLQVRPIGPHQMAEVDFGDYNVPSDASVGAVSVTYDGPDNSIIGRIFGIADKTYGFYSTLETYLPGAQSEVYWTTQGDYVSLLTLTNFADQEDRVQVTVTLGGGGTVDLPEMTLQPFESVSVNMRDLKERNILPASAAYGGFRISGRSRLDSKLLVKEHIVTENGRTSAPYYGGFPYVVEFCFYYYGCLYSKDLDTDDTAEGIAVYVWNDYYTTSSDTRDWYNIWGTQNSNTSLSAGTLGTSSVTVTGASVGSGGVGGTSLAVPADGFGNLGTFQAFLQVRVNQRCFAQLKYRALSIGGVSTGFNHAFWWIQTSSGTKYVTEGGPENSTCAPNCGHLVNWIVQGDIGHYSEDNSGASTAWSSAVSSAVCSAVTSLHDYAITFPTTMYLYTVGTVNNSNTYAHWAGNAAGFSPTQPPSTPGW